MKLRTIIVDDEPTARRTLQNLLENYTDDIEIVATASDVLSGVKAINKHNPDLVFLDVRMPGYSGFKLVEYFDELHFKLIFTTAFEEYVVEAFEAGASGYLLKPIDIDDLNTMVDKVRQEINLEHSNYKLTESKAVSFNRNTGITILPSVGGLLRLKTDEILYVEAMGRQVKINLTDNSSMIANINLKSILDIFAKTTFVRVHKSSIVNFTHVKKYSKGKDSTVTLYNDINLNVGKVYKDGLNEIISYLPK